MVSHPETGSDPPIGTDRESRRDIRPLGKAIVWKNSPLRSRVRVGQIWYTYRVLMSFLTWMS